jgi:hypothetical protein
MLQVESARESSRWSVAGTIGREGEEDIARLGIGYRLPFSGEQAANAEAREALINERYRLAKLEIDKLAARLAAARERSVALDGERLLGRAEVEEALAALDARLALGRDRPSQILPLRRQLVVALATAINARAERLRASFEVETLTMESSP